MGRITSGNYLFRYLKTSALLTAMCLCVPLCAQNGQEQAPSIGTISTATSSIGRSMINASTIDAPNIDAPGIDAPQQADAAGDPAANPNSTPIVTTREKWNNFVHETASLLTLGGGTFNAVFSRVTHTDPKYGGGAGAFAERFGASMADIATQNFFGDFVIASTFHEDPRYFRMGSGHPFWTRASYAISRALIIRKDSGGEMFNFDNVCGSALSTGFSNLYYPPASRTGKAMFMNWGIDVADNGFVNLAPEFWPDFRDKILRRHHRQGR
ncbi:MAG: hypothetical protein WA824_04355 [Candidatus Sulfotelmatobacter sp.]